MAWRDEDVVKAPIEVTWQPKEITQHRSRDQPQTMIKANLWKMDRALQNEVLQNDLPLPDTVVVGRNHFRMPGANTSCVMTVLAGIRTTSPKLRKLAQLASKRSVP